MRRHPSYLPALLCPSTSSLAAAEDDDGDGFDNDRPLPSPGGNPPLPSSAPLLRPPSLRPPRSAPLLRSARGPLLSLSTPLRSWPAAPSLCSAPRLLSTGEFILHRHLHVGPTVLSHVVNRVNDATSGETTSQTTEGGDLLWFSKLKEPIYLVLRLRDVI